MKIEWTSCADKMPPFSGVKVFIVKSDQRRQASLFTGREINCSFYNCKNVEWTPYRPEIWEELNK